MHTQPDNTPAGVIPSTVTVTAQLEALISQLESLDNEINNLKADLSPVLFPMGETKSGSSSSENLSDTSPLVSKLTHLIDSGSALTNNVAEIRRRLQL